MTKKSEKAWASFCERVQELGGSVVEPMWLGAAVKHRVLCHLGHEAAPQPQYVARGGGICATCGYASRTSAMSQRSKDAETRFREEVSLAGGTVIGQWSTRHEPVHVRCGCGADCYPMPGNVLSGQGYCLACTWASQDVIYVVFNPTASQVKFGITSGDPGHRLRAHRADGFTEVCAIRMGLPVGMAHSAEQSIIRSLESMGATPVKGREYFDGAYAMTILALVDSFLR